MSEPNAAEISPLISRNAANEQFREAVRLFIGRGRRYSVKQAEKGSGIKARMIESFMAPTEGNEFRKPDFEEVLSLSAFLGPEFTCEWIKLADQGAFWLPDVDDKPPGELAADTAEDAAAVARKAADGILDRDDVHHLRPHGRRMMINGARLAFG